MQASEGYVTTEDGIRLFFQKLGEGDGVVIVPNAVHMIESFRRLAEKRTVIFFDLRNRGRSDSVTDKAKLARGIHHDVDDIEAVRRHFALARFALIGHSYLGLSVILYAMKSPAYVGRLVQIGAPPPLAGTSYPPDLTGADATLAAFPGKMARLMTAGAADPRERCAKFWELIRELYVADPADIGKITWTPCDCPNEYLSFMPHWIANVQPSIQALKLTPGDLARVTMPVLTIHGRRDRQSPYGGGRDWAMQLPDARLLTVDNAAHVPWIEAPDRVFTALETFLDGSWPESA